MINRIAIIPARGGSKRIKNKNIKPFCGKPIINYTLDTIIKSKLFKKIHVSTDSKEITKQLFLKPVRFEEHQNLLNENDRTIVSLLYHENMIDVISYKNNLKLYLKMLDNFCYGDYIDRITFQNQIWQFNEMSSLIKTFYNNYLLHSSLHEINLHIDEVRFTKILTKYSTEYNNQQFIFHMCQEMNLDKKDMFSYFQELRNKLGSQVYEKQSFFDETFVNENINKLDIKRIYKYMDKSCKKELEDIIEYDN